MSKPLDPQTWFDDDRCLAAVFPADDLFGLLRRSFTLPPAFCALAMRKSGDHRVYRPGEDVPAVDVSEVLFARVQPLDLSLSIRQLPAHDKYLCDAQVAVQVRILPERGELDSFRDRVMGSRQGVSASAVQTYLHAAVDAALRSLVQKYPVADLLDGRYAAEGAAQLEEALKGPCFAGGMELASEPALRFTSDAYRKVRRAEERAARKLDEHQAQRELREALTKAQRDKLAHLESMLAKLKALADDSPDVELPELMRAFDESQRGQLYQALFESRARQRVTQWIVVVAGHEVLFFDPHSPEEPARKIAVSGAAGALRSVRLAPPADAGGENVLLLGAARGVYEMGASRTEPDRTYLFEAAETLRGGVNAAAMTATDLVATHSEHGIIHWRLSDPGHPTRLLAERTAAAKAVRNAQFAADRFWCSIDHVIIHLPHDSLIDEPRIINAGQAVITALCVADQHLYVGNAEGEVRQIDDSPGATPRTIHAGSKRPAESVALINTGGIARLFYTDTSLAVFSRVVGDTFVCRYEAGGQTIRRAEVAPDIIAATTDARDRVIVWTPDNPQRPAAVIPVSQLTGRSVQDICLLPRA